MSALLYSNEQQTATWMLVRNDHRFLTPVDGMWSSWHTAAPVLYYIPKQSNIIIMLVYKWLSIIKLYQISHIYDVSDIEKCLAYSRIYSANIIDYMERNNWRSLYFKVLKKLDV